jgi:hypothetical protein
MLALLCVAMACDAVVAQTPTQSPRVWARADLGLSLGTEWGVASSIGAGIEVHRRLRVGPEVAWVAAVNFDQHERLRIALLSLSLARDSASRVHWRIGAGDVQHVRDDSFFRRETNGFGFLIGCAFVQRFRPVGLSVSADFIAQPEAHGGDQATAIALVRVGLLARQR